jgi:hypothetical protein
VRVLIERCKYFYSAVGSFSHHSTESILIHLQRVTQAKLYYFKRRKHVTCPMFSMLFGCSQYRCSHTRTCLRVKFSIRIVIARGLTTTIPSLRPIFLPSCLLPSRLYQGVVLNAFGIQRPNILQIIVGLRVVF